MPLVCGSIVVDPVRRAKGQPAVGAADKHHICTVAVGRRAYARHHVNVVVSRAAGAIHRQEYLACKACRVYRSANETAPHADCRDLIKSWSDSRILRVRRANTPEAASAIAAANEKIAATGDVECSPMSGVGKIKRALPCYAGIGRAAKQATSASGRRTPSLILKPMPHSVGSVDREPLFVTSSCVSIRLQLHPGLPAVG